MLEALGRLISGLTAASVLVAVSLALTPKGAGAKVVRFVGGLTLTLTALSTFKAVPWDTWTPVTAAAPITVSGELPGEKVLASLIEDKTAAYILAKAQALGLDAEVRVKTQPDENGVFMPSAVRVALQAPFTEEARLALARVIREECGILDKNQQIIPKE